MPKLPTLAVLFFIFSFCGFSQPYKFRFHSYNTEHGLPSTTVNTLTEDVHGFIWIGTHDGLCRFDANSFKTFRKTNDNDNGLSNNQITALLAEANGDLWVGTSEGLHYFDGKTEKFTDLQKLLKLKPAYISKIISDGHGSLWIGSSEGLYFYTPATQNIKHYTPDPANSSSLPSEKIFDVLLDKKGRLWISSSRKGLSLFIPATKSFRSFRNDPNDPSSISSDVLRKMAETPDGRIIVGTSDQGFNLLDPEQLTFTRYNYDPDDPFSVSASSAFSVLADHQQNIWIGTWSNGLNLVDLQSGRARRFVHDPNNPHSLPHNAVQCLMQSSSGDIWIGTNNGGLSRLHPDEQVFVRYQHESDNENTLSTSYTLSVYEDDNGILWIGTRQGGLHRYDRKTEKFTHYMKPDGSRDGLARGTIWSISPGDENTLWLGTSRGLAKFDKNTGRCIFYEPDDKNLTRGPSVNNILSVLDDRQGNVWLGTWHGGLNRLHIKSGTFEHFLHNEKDTFSLSTDNINDIHLDKKGRLWIASDRSLDLFNPDKGNFTHYKSGALMITEDANGIFWMASDAGVTRFDSDNGSTTFLQEKDGLVSDLVSSVLVDHEGKIWIGSNKGVDCYDPKTKQIVNYDKADGLAGSDNEARACFLSSSGKLFFGGLAGLTEIDPTLLKAKVVQPEVKLTNLLLFNRPVAVSDSTKLNQSIHTLDRLSLLHTDYIFAIEFSAISFDQPHKNQYAYKLEGFDENWVYTTHSDRKAVYTHVPPGDYVFQVKASNHQGVWSEKVTTIAITVIPPWWQTWWATLFFYAVIVIVILAFIQIRFALIKRQKEVLQALVLERTAEVTLQKEEIQTQAERLQEVNLQKSKLFSIIAHDLRSPLNSLKGILQLLDPKILSASDLNQIRSSIHSQLNGIDTVMDNLLAWAKSQLEGEVIRQENFTIDKIAKEKLDLFTPVAERKEINLICTVPQGIKVHADINQIRAVMRNLVSNALKFTEKNGMVKISAHENAEDVIISVSDSGVGMSPEQIKKLFSIQTNISTTGTGGEKGVGLGLLLVNEFVEKNGGRVTVESKPGMGTTFSFTLRKEN
ncbi:MAG: ligand-binding sensor domain-containing protein [Bacteroidota bacterium]